jgi:nucleotide-binding universal stress UspA family protein
MGLRHANAMGRILGSVATVGIHRWEFPVLVVPEGVEYRPTKTILLATDLKGSGEWKEINMLEHLADTLPAEIHVLNVIRGEQVEGRQENIAGNRLEQKLYGHPHTWHFSIDDDVVTAVSETAARISADWIAVVPHHLPWYKELFHRSVSKQLMFASDRPLLVLPGENQ